HAPAWECSLDAPASSFSKKLVHSFSVHATLERRSMHSHAGAWERDFMRVCLSLTAMGFTTVTNTKDASPNFL
ncbi:hypothetical protein MHK_005123, partial [Candidatus Magnetomorum sp. HK-1]